MKHILFIFFDQLRYDAIGANGNPHILTPALDALAAESVKFERCLTPSPVCVPARLSLLAGQYPARTGNSNNNPNLQYTGEGLYATLTKAGYDSYNVGKMHHVWDKLGKIGFKHRLVQEPQANDDYLKFIQESPYSHVFDPNGQRSDLYYVPQVSQLPAEYHPTAWVVDRSLDYLDECNPEKDNVFLFTSIFQPHPPFTPPAPWNKIYRTYAGKEPYVPENFDPCSFAPLLYDRFAMSRLGISDIDLKRLRNFYYACVTFADYQISRLIDKLKEKGMYDDTLIIVSSDHGEMLGDYNTMGKRTMFDAACHVPLMMKIPGHAPETRTDVCSLVDVAPTLLSYAGVPYDKEEFDGIDLFSERHSEVYSQYECGLKGVYMVADDNDKLIYNVKEQLYYYLKDRDESRNQYKKYEHDPHLLEMKAKLDAYIASDRGIPSEPGIPSTPPFGLAPNDCQHTRQKELERVPEPYRSRMILSENKNKKKKK